MEKALEAWEATQPTDVPLEATPGQSSCGGFCDWKAWCPHWWNWRLENGTLGTEDFSDSVILLHHFDDRNGSGMRKYVSQQMLKEEQCQQVYRLPINFDGRGKEASARATCNRPPRSNFHWECYDKS